MEVWLDNRYSIENNLVESYPFDKLLSHNLVKDNVTLICKKDSIYLGEQVIGYLALITDGQSQNNARQLIGSVNWIVLEFENWSMIPLENLIAACQDTPTKIAAKIRTANEAQGAGFALESGVDALIVEGDTEMIEAAFIIKSQRGEKNNPQPVVDFQTNNLEIVKLKIKSVEEGGVGERYCIDLTSLLLPGEGLLIGSSASSLALVHGETVESEFVPPRPFRVNAGPPHSYVMMGNGNTKYISELKSNDSVLISNHNGTTRIGEIGRLKIEKRPFLHISWNDIFDKPSSIFLQQAETVRLINSHEKLISVTSLKAGDSILGWNGDGSRHIGEKISSKVDER